MLQVDQDGDPPGGARRVALRKLVSSSPSAATSSSRVGSSTSGRPWSATARMTVAQPTPKSRATAATAWASLPTRRHASARARWVSTARGAIPATRSVQVRTLQAGPRQRHKRLRQHSTTGRPADRQVTHAHHAAAMRSGSYAAAHTPDHRGRGLEGKLPFATHELGRHDLQALQA
jgi:hypothetical protein